MTLFWFLKGKFVKWLQLFLYLGYVFVLGGKHGMFFFFFSGTFDTQGQDFIFILFRYELLHSAFGRSTSGAVEQWPSHGKAKRANSTAVRMQITGSCVATWRYEVPAPSATLHAGTRTDRFIPFCSRKTDRFWDAEVLQFVTPCDYLERNACLTKESKFSSVLCEVLCLFKYLPCQSVFHAAHSFVFSGNKKMTKRCHACPPSHFLFQIF